MPKTQRLTAAAVSALALMLAAPVSAQNASGPSTTEAVPPQRVTSAAGTELTVPSGWTHSASGPVTTLGSADGGLTVRVVDVEGGEVASAIDRAWAAAQPDFARVELVTNERAPEDGWDAAFSRIYRTSPDERRFIAAWAMRRGEQWSVILLDASDAAYEINLGGWVALVESIRPAGYVPENLAGRAARPFDDARHSELRNFLETAMADLGIPAVSYAVVSRDGIIASGGLGVRELGRPDPVDADTLYMVASNTKSLTTLVFAQLVDEGRVRWDQPVTQLYPDFRMGSAEATAAAQVRHLICACTGLPRRDLDWTMTANLETPASLVFAQLANITPTSGFGSQYQYSNHLAAAAGFIAGHVVHPEMELGAAYDRTISERVLQPLGMTRSTFDFARVLADANHARPYADTLAGDPALADQGFNYSVYFMRPTGGLWSSANDMARYVRNELREGVLPDGRRMVSEENLRMRRMRGVQTGETSWYGMGLETELFSGVELVHHGGSMLGYKSDIVMFPEAGIGAVLLTNSENGSALLRPWLRRVVELLYDGEQRAARQVHFAARRIDSQRAAFTADFDSAPRPANVARLATRYTHPELGFIDIERDGEAVRFNFGAFATRVTTQPNDDGTIAFVATDPGLLGFGFTVRTLPGDHDALVVREAQHEYVYEPAS